MIKNLMVITLFICSSAFSGDQEEQRKYIFKANSAGINELVSSGTLNGLKTISHSRYHYFDIYLDTENRDLYKKNLSFRIRKRNFPDGSDEYGIQLKSEMESFGAVRMEVEEDEIRFFKIVYQGEVYSLKDIVSDMFDHFEEQTRQNKLVRFDQDEFMQERLSLIAEWTNFKMEAAIAPFQKLTKSEIALRSLKTLAPVMIGKSVRVRSHIYIDRDNTSEVLESFPASQRSQIDTPDLVKGSKNVWAMESSLDEARFYSLVSGKNFFTINEYEVENKFLPRDSGRELLDRFESGLVKDYSAVPGLDSKYRQSMNYFLN